MTERPEQLRILAVVAPAMQEEIHRQLTSFGMEPVLVGSASELAHHTRNGETYHVDRRSYLAKSVPQRMAIISAGVVMNVIFAFIFAVIAYGMGV